MNDSARSSRDTRQRDSSGPPGGTLGTIGPYVLLERLPGRAPVPQYLAKQKGPFGFERTCWIKATKQPREGEDIRAAEGLAREAQTVTSLDHPGILKAYDFHSVDGYLVLSFEYFSRLSLAQLRTMAQEAGKPIPEMAVWTLAHTLFDAIAWAHSEAPRAPLVHGDVRPANLWLRADGTVRLGGFGSSKAGRKDEITAVGMVAERPSYMSPEQVRGHAVDERTDLFSAALIVWELLTGESATPAEMNDFQLLQYLSTRQLEPLRSLRSDIPALATTALDLCLQTEPEQRTISAQEVAGCILSAMPLESSRQTLRDFIAELGPSAQRSALAPMQAPPSSKPKEHRHAHRPRPPKPSGDGESTVTVAVPQRSSGTPQVTFTDGEGAWSGSDAVTLNQRLETAAGGVQIHEAGRDVAPEAEDGQTTPLPSDGKRVPSEGPTSTNSNVTESSAPSTEPSAQDASSAQAQLPTRSTSGDQSDPSGALDLSSVDHQFAAPTSGKSGRKTGIWLGIAAGVAVVAGIAWFVGGGSSEPKPAPAPSSAPRQLGLRKNVPPMPAASHSHADARPSAKVPRFKTELTVKSPPKGWVYIQGVPVGPTDKPLLVNCSHRARFLRVGTHRWPGRSPKSVRWLARGQSVMLRCGQRVEVAAMPSK